jgi:hypothetical protein
MCVSVGVHVGGHSCRCVRLGVHVCVLGGRSCMYVRVGIHVCMLE